MTSCGPRAAVDLGDDAGRALAAVVLPCPADGIDETLGPGRRRRGEETVAPPGDALERGGLEAAEQDLGAAVAGGGGADGTDLIAVGVAGPQAAHQRHLLVQAAAPGPDI